MLPAADRHPLKTSTLRAFGWLFASLSLAALLAQPGATHDEWYHVASIWCGHGENKPFCSEETIDPIDGPKALINLNELNCQRPAEKPLLCPTKAGSSETIKNGGLYPGLFYFILSWFVVPWGTNSVVIVRIISAAIISGVLAVLTQLLPPKYRVVLLLVMLTTLTSTGFFLFGSINPSSWSTLGVGFGWLGVHASLLSGDLSKSRRVMLAATGIGLWILAAGSRWDAPAYLAVAGGLTMLHFLIERFSKSRFKVLAGVTGLVLGAVVLLQMATPLKPSDFANRIFSYEEGDVDNLTFVTHYLVHAVPNMLQALGTVPSMSGIVIPEIIFIGGVALLFWFIVLMANRKSAFQPFGALAVVIAASVALMAQVDLVDDRDLFGVEPRYVFPLLVFGSGWWFLHGPEHSLTRAVSHLRPAFIAATALFAFTSYTTTERYVDAQSFGIRILPEGPDNWWWSWMPVGPNVVLILTVLCMWQFYRCFAALIARAPIAAGKV